MSELFHIVEDACAILVASNGVYRQAKVYRRGNDLFAAHGTGFIRIYRNGTSVPTIRCEELIGVIASYDKLGRAMVNK